MNNLNTRKIYIILFSLLYLCTAFVSTTHAIAFFSLANIWWMGIILAITFEIGQAAVLFSILTDKTNRKKIMPWCLMSVLTFVQILGNVFSSYKYILTNSIVDLKYFKEPIFVWTDLPDNITTVIVTYLLGALLPVICLLLTSMVTGYLDNDDKPSNVNDDKQSNVNDDKPSNANDDKPLTDYEPEPIEQEEQINETIEENNEESSEIEEIPQIENNESIDSNQNPPEDVLDSPQEHLNTSINNPSEEIENTPEEVLETKQEMFPFEELENEKLGTSIQKPKRESEFINL